MEHLLDDRELEEFSDQINWIPWLGFDHDRTQVYDPVFIDEYPILRGWSRDRLDVIQREPVTEIGTLAMLQSWLVFGLLESILRIQITSSPFIRDTANGRIIDTTVFRRVTLPYLTQFHRKICEIPEVEAVYTENLIRTLKFSERWNRALLFETRCSPDLQEIYDSIIGLSAMLSETLFGLQEQLSK